MMIREWKFKDFLAESNSTNGELKMVQIFGSSLINYY